MVFGSVVFFFSRRRRHTRFGRYWSSDVCSSGLIIVGHGEGVVLDGRLPRVVGAGDLPKERLEDRADVQVAQDGGEGALTPRSEERRVGKECRVRWCRCDETIKKKQYKVDTGKSV